MPMHKIFIGVPAYGQTFYTSCVRSLFRLAIELDRRKLQPILATVSHADIAEGRNMLLTHWFDETDASHLLFVDADMGFEPQLILDMIEFDKPVVGAVYPRRKIDLDRFAKAIGAGQPTQKAAASAYDYVVQKPSRATAHKGFIRVEGCGTGVLLIQRSCVKTMIEKLPQIVDLRAQEGVGPGGAARRLIRAFEFLTVDGDRLSEDFSFCYRWREMCAGEIWANISHQISHVGLQQFTARFSDVAGTRVTIVQTPRPANNVTVKK